MLKKEPVLNFDFEIAEIKEKFGCEEWVTAVLLNENVPSSDTIYCVLIPESMSEEAIDDPSWAFQMGDGLPQYVTSYHEGKEEKKYYRFSYNSIEPLVILRKFHGIKGNTGK